MIHRALQMSKLGIKSSVKKIGLERRRQAAWQSISLRLVGRLFQMSGAETENAHLPNWVLVRLTTADLTVDDRTWRRWGSLEQKVTRSLWYEGAQWWKMFCMSIATLKIIRNFTGNQWSCCRVGVMWDCRLRPRISRAAAYWTRRRGVKVGLDVAL